jgi:hypothetical protein
MIADDFMPRAVRHLAGPYDDGISEHVIIAYVNDQPHLGYKGSVELTTALIPLDVVDEVLEARGSIGHEVETWGPHPCVDEDSIYSTRFWIDGRPHYEERFETPLNAWKHHDQFVALPDSIFLMTYGLIPRQLENGDVCWDDPQRPTYDVVRARSHVDYNNKVRYPLIEVSVRRDYLEDFCSLKKAALVAVYYEERFDIGDQAHTNALAGVEGAQFELPGRLLALATLNDQYSTDAPQMSRVWGSRLILKPIGRPISNAVKPELEWPDHSGAMSKARAAQEWLYAYVSDEVLIQYESKPEFSIHPESGGVSYGGWWGTTRTTRVGRSYIELNSKSYMRVVLRT